MEAFTEHRGKMATLDRANVDTDAIIPKQFLKSIQRTGFGPSLFFDWRYTEDAKPDPAFELNQPKYDGASVLVARNNFGCGSSREHAVWAVLQDGYQVVVAPYVERDGTVIPGFADIFKNNASKNGLLTIELSEPEVEELFQAASGDVAPEASVNLEQQTLVVHGTEEKTYTFDIDPGVKEHLLRGLDDIALTLEFESEITAFEKQHDTQMSQA